MPHQLTTVTNCRVCGAALFPVMDLGHQYPVCFPERLEVLRDGVTLPVQYRLRLGLCTNKPCSLVQLLENIPPEALYREYWYRSGINPAMVEALRDVVDCARRRVELAPHDWVVDIGANDGTLLDQYEGPVHKCAFEPALNLAEYITKAADVVVHDFFPPKQGLANTIPQNILGKAKIVTAISMAYDLPDPNEFFAAVADILHPDGLFICQVGYLGDMFRYNSFDQVCHEHIEYYSLMSLSYAMARVGLVVEDMSWNGTNGGSIRLYVRHEKTGAAPNPKVLSWLHDEEISGVAGTVPYEALMQRLERIKAEVLDVVNSASAVTVYGASTKGLTLMQYFGLTSHQVAYAVERDVRKHGRYYGYTGIPIVSEEEWRHTLSPKGQVALVLPWHFKYAILEREAGWMRRGGKFLFPLPAAKMERG